ncbi:MAG TPA: histidine--tRNA ligase [Gemmatimonadales bacterium]|nr:histidine--tRNA ligase [Gemmatimonadales bacterium]
MPPSALPGFRDVFPDALARRRRIFAAWRDVAARYGFEEYDGPPLEPVDLYTRKSGDEIVEQLYRFTDKGDRDVALRPEMTPTLARMVAQRAAQLRKPIRWFSIPQLFRYERQQRGRLREHFQLNMDIIGESGPLADAEVIAAALDIVRALGFGPGDVRARVSDRRVLGAALADRYAVTAEELPGVLAALDKYEKAPEAAREALGAALGRSGGGDAEARAARLMDFFKALSDPAPLLALEAAAPLRACVDALGAMGLGAFVDVDFRIVRGLAYYTGVVFELFDAKRTLRAICGGGRYDDLLAQLGGVDLPCVGFGMGDVVLGELLGERDGPPKAEPAVAVFVAAVGDEDRPAALGLAHALRERGLAVEFALKKQAVGKQLELAAARGARAAIVIGPTERAAGEAVVRRLGTGTEQRVALTQLAKDYAF